MTIDVAGSPTTASTSVFDENMTWSRPTGGSASSTNEARSIDSATTILSNDDDDEQQLRRLIAAATATTTTTTRDDRSRTAQIADQEEEEEEEEEELDQQGPNSVEQQRTASNETERDANDTNVRQVETIGRTTGDDDCACARFGDGDIVSEGGRLPFFVGEPSSFDETESVANTSEGSTTSVGFDGSSTGLDVTTTTTTDREDVEGLRELELLFGLGGIMEDLGGSFNDSFNESLLFPCNGTRCNETSYIVFGESLYPSGYTLPHIILASVLATLLMIVIVVGNMLVIIAIATEKALKNIQNWFIASLAVADFFLGLVIMPFSLANEIMGYWIFGYWWCDIYSAMDVLLCTASIMNLCLISLDRFWSITQAVDYLKKRTPARAALMIALVWLLSALVCIPPLLGWKRPTPAEEYPKCKVRRLRLSPPLFHLAKFLRYSMQQRR
ncbi:hypothetical protein K0M31_009233 [Melipona bicolor]|uniref:G-protein coupled receptors family 1 profile domain-containing protein n=1 Tax=Melipona bicolor TaxID=60889 RepID=A0AA40FPQ3_9HYME|nr:hypothetical protein K0M31_009233 [Melipona bicolor]